MKKIVFCVGTIVTASASLIAQPVSDRAVVPVGVTLNQVMRLHITNGGNIEFVFNQIDQYKSGISNAAAGATDFYDTEFTISSSTNWTLLMGAENATFLGTEDPGNTMSLDNVGYRIAKAAGGNSCCAATSDITTGADATAALATSFADGTPTALAAFTGAAPVVISTGTAGNAGEADDNIFEISWECGTTATGGIPAMNTAPLLDQNLTPDRYVTNVFLDVNCSGCP